MQNRAARRRTSGGSPQPPRKRRIPSAWVIVAALIVAAIAGVAYGNRRLTPDLLRTPPPGPNASSPATQLVDGETLGATSLPTLTPKSGHGQPVDGIECAAQEYAAIHIHAHLALFVDGKQIAIPSRVGIPTNGGQPFCTYWVHTHDASGIIHVESPVAQAFTFGQFFDIWGEPLDRTHAASYNGSLRFYVNGSRYNGDPRSIPLTSHQNVTIEIGSKAVPPPNYSFPANE